MIPVRVLIDTSMVVKADQVVMIDDAQLPLLKGRVEVVKAEPVTEAEPAKAVKKAKKAGK